MRLRERRQARGKRRVASRRWRPVQIDDINTLPGKIPGETVQADIDHGHGL